MGCGTSFVKYVLFFFNLLVAVEDQIRENVRQNPQNRRVNPELQRGRALQQALVERLWRERLLLGMAVIGVGVAFLLNWAPVKDELQTHFTVAPWLFIVIGAIMFVIAFFGCCGAIRESHCMVVTYAIFLLVIIIMQVILAVLLFTYGDTIKVGLEKGVDGLWNKRTRDGAASEVFNNIQTQLQCCGNNGAGDYYSAVLDKSCCNADSFGSQVVGCTIATAYPGCRKQIGDLYEKWNKPIAGIAIGVACIEVVGALFALCLANSIRNMDRRSHY